MKLLSNLNSEHVGLSSYNLSIEPNTMPVLQTALNLPWDKLAYTIYISIDEIRLSKLAVSHCFLTYAE